LTAAQVRTYGYGKDVMVNDEDRESDDEVDDEFEGGAVGQRG